MKALVFVLLLSVPASAADKLGSFRRQFRGYATAKAAGDVVDADHDGSLMQAIGFLLAVPYAFSLDMEPQGYAPYAYAEGPHGDEGERRWAQRIETFFHRIGDGTGGWGGRYRLDSERHVGLEAAWTHYRESGDEDLHYLYGAAHGDIVRDDQWRLDYQLGLSALAGRETRVGPRLALETEAFPRKPFFVDAHSAVSFIDNGPLGELRAGAGVAIKAVQVRFGWRALIGPFRTLDGPDAGLTLRF